MSNQDPYDMFGAPPGGFSGYPEPIPGGDVLPEPAKGRRRRRSRGGDGGEPTPPVTRRVVGVNRTLAIVFAVLVAVLALVLILGSSEGKKTFVLRTTTAVPAASPLTESNVAAVEVSLETVEPGALSGPDGVKLKADALSRLAGQSARYSVPAGRQVHPEDFTGSLLSDGQEDPAMRAMSIRVAYGDAVGGIVGVGDRVDIVGVAGSGGVTSVVAQDIPILAVTSAESQLSDAASQLSQEGNRDKSASDLLPTKPLPGIYTIRVPAEMVAPLASLSADGKLILVLRGPKSGNAPDTSVVDPLTAVCAAASGAPSPLCPAGP